MVADVETAGILPGKMKVSWHHMAPKTGFSCDALVNQCQSYLTQPGEN
jgi:hypothetical protein